MRCINHNIKFMMLLINTCRRTTTKTYSLPLGIHVYHSTRHSTGQRSTPYQCQRVKLHGTGSHLIKAYSSNPSTTSLGSNVPIHPRSPKPSSPGAEPFLFHVTNIGLHHKIITPLFLLPSLSSTSQFSTTSDIHNTHSDAYHEKAPKYDCASLSPPPCPRGKAWAEPPTPSPEAARFFPPKRSKSTSKQ